MFDVARCQSFGISTDPSANRPLGLLPHSHFRGLEGHAAAPDPAVAIRVFGEVLLVIVGASAVFPAEVSQLDRCGHVVGRLLVVVDVDPPVGQT
jgi:hypothetical protein